MYFCGVDYMEEDYMIPEEEVAIPEDLPSQLRRIQETVRFLEDDEVEFINVPVPEFSNSDPADIVHDFNRVRAQTCSQHTEEGPCGVHTFSSL